ncbi:hypothetical protein GGP41_004478 [Bipolaris sorokiniana]|uniref:Secreted protein n=1 Tax=Cochliobolus sativus TaxID=45130 RepID=A0A8H5ZAD8_COCSA|nr:hypothetical protein GGP41_004478 [Bipolaris sorokiniana]
MFLRIIPAFSAYVLRIWLGFKCVTGLTAGWCQGKICKIGERREVTISHKKDLQRQYGDTSRDVVESRNRHRRVEQLVVWTPQRRGCQDCHCVSCVTAKAAALNTKTTLQLEAIQPHAITITVDFP